MCPAWDWVSFVVNLVSSLKKVERRSCQARNHNADTSLLLKFCLLSIVVEDDVLITQSLLASSWLLAVTGLPHKCYLRLCPPCYLPSVQGFKTSSWLCKLWALDLPSTSIQFKLAFVLTCIFMDKPPKINIRKVCCSGTDLFIFKDLCFLQHEYVACRA